jgi:hypothetical protein
LLAIHRSAAQGHQRRWEITVVLAVLSSGVLMGRLGRCVYASGRRMKPGNDFSSGIA